jgi:hypothetical protein
MGVREAIEHWAISTSDGPSKVGLKKLDRDLIRLSGVLEGSRRFMACSNQRACSDNMNHDPNLQLGRGRIASCRSDAPENSYDECQEPPRPFFSNG